LIKFKSWIPFFSLQIKSMSQKISTAIWITFMALNIAAYCYFRFNKDIETRKKLLTWWLYFIFATPSILIFIATSMPLVLFATLPVGIFVAYMNIKVIVFCNLCKAMVWRKYIPENCTKCGVKINTF
jgi:hypothetical protein